MFSLFSGYDQIINATKNFMKVGKPSEVVTKRRSVFEEGKWRNWLLFCPDYCPGNQGYFILFCSDNLSGRGETLFLSMVQPR